MVAHWRKNKVIPYLVLYQIKGIRLTESTKADEGSKSKLPEIKRSSEKARNERFKSIPRRLGGLESVGEVDNDLEATSLPPEPRKKSRVDKKTRFSDSSYKNLKSSRKNKNPKSSVSRNLGQTTNEGPKYRHRNKHSYNMGEGPKNLGHTSRANIFKKDDLASESSDVLEESKLSISSTSKRSNKRFKKRGSKSPMKSNMKSGPKSILKSSQKPASSLKSS